MGLYNDKNVKRNVCTLYMKQRSILQLTYCLKIKKMKVIKDLHVSNYQLNDNTHNRRYNT